MHNTSSPECWVCGHPESRLWLEQGGTATYRCPACGLVFSPEVSASALNAEIYSHQLTQTHKSEQAGKHRKSRLRRHILRPLESFRQTGKVLEVGFGRGEFLEAADAAGWQVQGIDVAPGVVEWVRRQYGFQVWQGTLDEVDLPPEEFDAIYLNEVLEHVAYPLALMQRVAALLRPGGVVVVGTPNADSWVAAYAGKRWEKLDVSRTGHVSLFTPGSLRCLCRRAGLEVVRISTSGFTIRGLYQEHSRGVRTWVRLFEKIPRPLAVALRKGSTLRLWARKPGEHS